MLLAYGYLAVAILAEIVSSSLLKMTDGFKRLGPTLIVIVGYGITFFLLSVALEQLQLGVAYALWAGIGTLFTSVLGVVLYKEAVTRNKIIGVLLIIAGAILLNL
ncbi:MULTISPECIES: DMT family transporter [Loigolactobacillus]|uniref:Quaternary ammonium transporter n=1 Tax=Loigolactobacillus backii TaxID=375175 RepID=A0A192H0B6_9LACO|nr:MULTISPECIES: multidrug efflux SMR transporter [Loigolactobacillus]ANK60748.1 quaternary ammonium transporter [Loigolactobacillus backii]ANK61682.1 quaternary ammonium transporter [Loigolactobacillus backii]ANK65701.1 quaternary ammonium transporter [Loigolactobacillus backii]ANK68178.1 quaternary ammonium transporter [Loigolactobacillus backii]ANK69120.1 quaternary ammonium transporter [Loigolactobacillus backii]